MMPEDLLEAKREEILSVSVKSHPEIPWAQIVAMRNMLVHEYFGVDLQEVWRTVERDLPVLKHQIETFVKRLEELGHGG